MEAFLNAIFVAGSVGTALAVMVKAGGMFHPWEQGYGGR